MRLYYISLSRYYIIQDDHVSETYYILTEGDYNEAVKSVSGEEKNEIVTIKAVRLEASTELFDRVTDLVI